jgi:HEAT repeat protein
MSPARTLPALLLLGWLSLPAGPALRAAAPPTPDEDRPLLRNAGFATDTAALLRFLHIHSRADIRPERIRELVRLLGSDDFDEREKASEELAAIGPPALVPLRKAVGRRADPEVVRRARTCLKAIERRDRPALCLAAVRLLVKRRPARAAAALLRYLPSAADETAEEGVVRGLADLAGKSGKVDPVFLSALKDTAPARRAIAACLVGRVGNAGQRAAVRRLLKDDSPLVRLRAAQGLLAGQDRAALPVLATLLDQPDTAIAWQAEELLRWAAGESAPDAVVGAGAAGERKKCRLAWETWLRGPKGKPDLAQRLRAGRPGLFLVYEVSAGERWSHRLALYGCDGVARWRLRVPGTIADLHLLPGNQVLLAEDGSVARRITTRDLAGKVVWQRAMQLCHPLACQRLVGGHTLVATTRGAVELAADGRQVFVHDPQRNRSTPIIVLGVVRLPAGDLLYAEEDLHASTCSFKEIGLTKAAGCQTPLPERVLRGQAFFLGNQRLAVVQKGGRPGKPDEVWLIDRAGRAVRHGQAQGVKHVAGLPDGGLVLACGQAGEGRVVEMAPNGARRWEVVLAGEARRVRPCLGLVRLGFPAPTSAATPKRQGRR